jgi:hypothetical protein
MTLSPEQLKVLQAAQKAIMEVMLYNLNRPRPPEPSVPVNPAVPLKEGDFPPK